MVKSVGIHRDTNNYHGTYLIIGPAFGSSEVYSNYANKTGLLENETIKQISREQSVLYVVFLAYKSKKCVSIESGTWVFLLEWVTSLSWHVGEIYLL